MIDIRKLKELVRLMVENDLSELDLQDQQETVTIKRGSAVMLNGAASGVPVVHHAPVGHAGGGSAHAAPADGAGGGGTSAPVDTSGLIAVKSPMVGTVYLAANPDTPPFVQSGASVGPDTTVCLIEAMKVFSEIKAETAGTIERVLVSNAQAVEYGQTLFLVRPQ
ncbi:MAG: acetyl-CoA carboxylase biotin carboxyl carrier protein [Phycisphaeraceae bacterium]|nr:acetyl-CoA carboxylase biotin carboxyl carrier protein [Phycisphaeraceae bacterium]